MTEPVKPRAVGLNHIALEVGDIEEALKFYGRLFRFGLRGKSDTMAFIDLGDQFIALQKGRRQPADDGRHFGLVVDDKEAARRALKDAGDRWGLSRFPRPQRHALGNLKLVGKQNHLCDAWTLVLALPRCQALLVAPARYCCVAIRLEDVRFYFHIFR
jgi:catechol 2,3-dioxygenase-like lactoylglutathione lyase family enzyme